MDLVCYIHPGWAPRIRPASNKRSWMEATPERFAYRCLPLAIANAHGWEVLNPCGFEARWTGGAGTDAVEIRLDPGTEARQAPVSLFGQGTIRQDGRKIHPMYLLQVKTPEESKADWDVFKVVGTIPADKAFRPMAEGGCPLVK